MSARHSSSASRSRQVKRASDASGIPVCAICTHSIHDPLQPDPAERARRFDTLGELLRQAEELGAAGVISVPARRPVTLPGIADDHALMALAVEAFTHWSWACPKDVQRS